MKRSATALALIVLGAAVLSGCGSGSERNSIDESASAWLQADVAAARTAVATGNAAQATDDLQKVLADVQSLHARHLIGDDRAATIQLDAQRAVFAIAASSTTTSATTSTTTSPPAAPFAVSPSTRPSPPAKPEHAPRPKHGKKGDG